MVYNNSFLKFGNFFNKNDSSTLGGEFIVDTFSFQGNTVNSLQQTGIITNFFGRNVADNLHPPVGQEPLFSANIYLPKTIFAQARSANENIMQPSGDTLFWNKDVNNIQGILITATYYPTRYINQSLIGSYPVTISKTITGIPDNGSYIIPSNI